MPVMSSVENAAIIAFSKNVHERVQQMSPRLKPYVELEQFKGKSMAYDGMGTIELEELNGRFAAVTFADLEFNRRKLVATRFGATVAVDEQIDINRMLYDPSSRIAKAMSYAAARKFDKVAYGAMFADVLTGEEFGTTVTAASDGVVTVDATAGLTYEKLLEINKNFINNEVGNDMKTKICMGVTGDEYYDMMSELELTSGDYTKQYVVDQGTITKAVGIDMIQFASAGAGGASPILGVASGVRTSFAMAEGAICVGITQDWQIEIEKRPDLYGTHQIKITGIMGAVRTEGKLIQKVTLTPD